MMASPASWEWKVEPLSPAYISVDNESEAWLFEEDVTPCTPTAFKEEKPHQPTRAEIASKLLEDLDEWIKEEPFSDWLEEKIDLPIFEDLPAVESRAYGHFSRGNNEALKPSVAVDVKNFSSPSQLVVANDTQSLLQEFESVFGEVELNNGTLTPPQSPTLPSSYQNVLTQDAHGGQLFITTLQQLIPVQAVSSTNSAPFRISPIVPIVFPEKKETLLTNLEQMVPATPVPDLARELADMEELVRTRVEDLETTVPLPNSWNVDSSGGSSPEFSSMTPPSPCTSSSSSFESGEDLCDDPEWIPEPVQSSAPGNLKCTGNCKRGNKPYSRVGGEEKRIRKKEQNKNAATRYRQKKKAEVEVILGEEKGLEDTNVELRQKVSDLSREIKYLKGLMRDVFRAKGMIK